MIRVKGTPNSRSPHTGNISPHAGRKRKAYLYRTPSILWYPEMSAISCSIENLLDAETGPLYHRYHDERFSQEAFVQLDEAGGLLYPPLERFTSARCFHLGDMPSFGRASATV